jgi:hypothetical protein
MRKQWYRTFFYLLTTTAAFLILCACNIPLENNPVQGAAITDMDISPRTGSSSFSLTLSYLRTSDVPAIITCNYLSPDGMTIGLAEIQVKDKPSNVMVSITDFSVTRAGKTIAGLYKATCTDDSGRSSESMDFYVDDKPDLKVQVTRLIVNQGPAEGMHKLDVTYVIKIPDDVSFTCSYVNPRGDTMAIDTFTEKGSTHDIPLIMTKTLEFSVTQQDGRIVSGTYTATCQDYELRSSESTTFTVSGNEPSSQVTKVVVTPPSGEYAFVMDVEYTTILQKDQPADKITCIYRSPSGKSAEVGSIIPNVIADKLGQPVKLSESLIFTVKGQDGKVETGVYEAACYSERNNFPLTTNFTVVEAKTAIFPLTGQIRFDISGVQTNPPGLGGLIDEVIRDCIPDVTFTSDGKIEGLCEYSGPTIIYTHATIKITVDGTIDQEGNFEFTYTAYVSDPNNWTLPDTSPDVDVWAEIWYYEVDISGNGALTAMGGASGVADFEYSCDTGADNLLACRESSPTYFFEGTIPWVFVLGGSN